MKSKVTHKLAIGAVCLALASYVIAGGHGSNSQNNSGGGNRASSGAGQTFNSQNGSDNQHNPFGQSTGDNVSTQATGHQNEQVEHRDNQVTSIGRGNREEMVIETHGERAGNDETGATSNTSTKSEADNVFGSKILETDLPATSSTAASGGSNQGADRNHQNGRLTSARKLTNNGNNEDNRSNEAMEHQEIASGDVHQEEQNQTGPADIEASANATNGKDANVEHQDRASDLSTGHNQDVGETLQEEQKQTGALDTDTDTDHTDG